MIGRGMLVSGLFLFLLLFSSCQNSASNNYNAKPSALGKMNEIVIICDDSLWESSLQDSLDYYFGGPYPIIPRPEPLFDIRHFTFQELMNEPLRRQLRTYLIIANLNDENSATRQMVISDLGAERVQRATVDSTYNTSVGRDKWATGQILIYLMGQSVDQLANNIRTNFNGISKRINEHDAYQLESTTFAKGENVGLNKKLFEKYGIQIKIPAEFVLADEDDRDRFVWIRKEVKEGTMSLVFRKVNYTRSEQLEKEYAKRLRDDYGRKYISSPEDNSYMVTNDVDLPMFEYTIEIGGHYAKEYRGIWEMENDFMGGPFASYLVLNEDESELLFVDAFVYVPGKAKRNFVQQLECIVKNLEW